jgi:hypothetical protein
MGPADDCSAVEWPPDVVARGGRKGWFGALRRERARMTALARPCTASSWPTTRWWGIWWSVPLFAFEQAGDRNSGRVTNDIGNRLQRHGFGGF